MTRLGLYLENRSINKSAVSRKTGISKARLSELSTKEHARLSAAELFLIALAIEVEPGNMLDELYAPLREEFRDSSAGEEKKKQP
ncbi:MAG: helix-turn-helix transcriptional regulator [Puia sp.]|nr:helix-turn-helix transcriptional regulator [Puia sp.]